MIASWANLDALPDSPYGAELRRRRGSPRFDAPVEAEYRRSSLRESRTLVRLVYTLALLLLALRGGESLTAALSTRISLTVFTAVLASTVMLTALAWSSSYEHSYLPWAQVLVPVRNCLVAAQVIHLAAQGQLANLMLLPMVLIGPFFFLGLPYGAALTTAVLSLASMAGATMVFHLPLPMVVRGGALLVVSVITLAIAARQIDKRSRRSFLETRVVTELAQQDALTWTKNRRVFEEYLPRLWRQAVSDGRTLSILVIDVDHFKTYNDRYGHQAGDAALRQVAFAIQRQVRRPLDLVARYGGEEFAVILYDTDCAGARSTAERMRRAVEALAIDHPKSQSGTVVTVSIGIAVVSPAATRNPFGALQLADEALYQAKAKGRNRVELMDEAAHRLSDTGIFAKEQLATLRRSRD